MIWVLTIIAQIWFGFEFSYFFLDKSFSIIFIFAFGIASGIGISSIIFYFISILFGNNIIHLFIHTAILLFLSFTLMRKRKKVPRKNTTSFFSHFPSSFYPLSWSNLRIIYEKRNPELIAFILYCLISINITWKVYFPSPRSLSYVYESQLTEELSFISSFRYGANKKLRINIKHPNFAGHFAVSNWLTAFHSSMLQTGFASLKTSLFIPTFLLLTSYSAIMYFFSIQFNLPSYFSFFVPIISLNLSGFGFLRFLYNHKRTSRTNDYVSQTGYGKCPRFHPLFHLYYGFRHSTLALPIVVGIIYILYCTVGYKYTRVSESLSLEYCGFIFGFVMPSVQYQSFIGFLIFSFIFIAIQITRPKNILRLKGFLIFLIIGFSFHLPRYLYFMNNHEGSVLFGYEVQWKYLVHHEFIPMLSLWWNNCGVFTIVYLFLSLFKLNSIEYYIYIPSAFCFFFFNFFKLQNLVQYNMFVFLTINYTTGSIIFMATLYRFSKAPKEAETRGVISALSLILVVSCTISALMGVKRQIGNVRQSWTMNDELLVNWIIKNTRKKSIFISPLISFNPVSSLAGRSSYIENNEVLAHIGFDFTEREMIYRKFMKNLDVEYEEADDDLKDVLDTVDYIVLLEKGNLNPNVWKEAYNSRSFAVYQNQKKKKQR